MLQIGYYHNREFQDIMKFNITSLSYSKDRTKIYFKKNNKKKHKLLALGAKKKKKPLSARAQSHSL